MHREDMPVHIGVAALSVAIFALDAMTPVGIAVWVFYMLPVALSVFQRHKYVPLLTALLELVLMAAGTLLATGDHLALQNVANRAFGVIALFATALLGMQVIAMRLETLRLAWLQQGESALAQEPQPQQEEPRVSNEEREGQGRAFRRDEERQLRRYSRSTLAKGAKSPERLLDEVSLFLHRVETSMPPDRQKPLARARQRDMVFEGRRILLVDDDVRDIFALSGVLEPLGAQLLVARNGREALDALGKETQVDIVLMDLTMAEMDGLAATREIRKRPELRHLPIIALTAKAMMDDHGNCLEAGANDYIAKPVDVPKLVSLCRVWMPK